MIFGMYLGRGILKLTKTTTGKFHLDNKAVKGISNAVTQRDRIFVRFSSV